jgi:hypothetical protein
MSIYTRNSSRKHSNIDTVKPLATFSEGTADKDDGCIKFIVAGKQFNASWTRKNKKMNILHFVVWTKKRTNKSYFKIPAYK